MLLSQIVNLIFLISEFYLIGAGSICKIIMMTYLYWLLQTRYSILDLVEDGYLMSDAENREFWGFFGGFAPLPRKTATDDHMFFKHVVTNGQLSALYNLS